MRFTVNLTAEQKLTIEQVVREAKGEAIFRSVASNTTECERRKATEKIAACQALLSQLQTGRVPRP
jgi:hypothetical protein